MSDVRLAWNYFKVLSSYIVGWLVYAGLMAAGLPKAVALVFGLGAGIGILTLVIRAWLRKRQTESKIKITGPNTAEIDGVQLTAHQQDLMKALQQASKEGGDVAIQMGEDGKVQYKRIP